MGFWNGCFCCSGRHVCYIKPRKSFVHDLFSRSMTWEYMGLQGVTGGYKGLQGVSSGYRGLQEVTKFYSGWQGVTKDYRNFFLTRTYPDTFSWSVLHKIKHEEILNFWSKRWTNLFGKILILRFSYTVVFIVFKGFFFI